MPFGGGGGIHAIPVCDELSLSRILVPLSPGVLCADGLLSAPTEHEFSSSYVTPFDTASPDDILSICARLREQCSQLMAREDIAGSTVETMYFADICYSGQSHYIEIPLDIETPATLLDTAYEQFVATHERLYGHSTRNKATLVNLRAVQRASNHAPERQFLEAAGEPPAARILEAAGEPPAARMREVRLIPADTRQPTQIYQRS